MAACLRQLKDFNKGLRVSHLQMARHSFQCNESSTCDLPVNENFNESEMFLQQKAFKFDAFTPLKSFTIASCLKHVSDNVLFNADDRTKANF